jgi:bifunctional ADP-heptose synthase (sugar kinase/adenylyltransferase)
MVAALRCVDAVVIFHEKRADRFLAAVKPHVYVKGGDYRPETLDPNERALLGKLRTRIQILPFVRGLSTTRLLDKLKRL